MTQKFTYKDTILELRFDKDVYSKIGEFVIKTRKQIEQFADEHPLFLTSLEPMDFKGDLPKPVELMVRSSDMAGTGPMAAVAGTIAQLAGEEAKRIGASWGYIENGGDVCVFGDQTFNVRIHAGQSKLSDKLALKIRPKGFKGVCTSSATVGHSMSFGQADAVTVVANETCIADAAATAIANKVEGKEAIDRGLKFARSLRGLDGVIIIKDDKIGKTGKIPDLIPLK